MKQKKVRILIVDDARIWMRQLASGFDRQGIDYDWVKNGFYAVNKIRDKMYYDAIIMDMIMPVMGGVEATRQIRKLGFTNPIIGYSSMYLEKPDLEEGKHIGITTYIAKRASLDGLMQLLRDLGIIDNEHAQNGCSRAT